MASEIEEIEAILREHIYATHGSTQCGRYTDYEVVELGGVSEGAQAISAYIAALRSKDREDGAREMRERAFRCARYLGDRAGLAIKGGCDGAQRMVAVRDTARALQSEIAALPLTTRTEDGDA